MNIKRILIPVSFLTALTLSGCSGINNKDHSDGAPSSSDISVPESDPSGKTSNGGIAPEITFMDTPSFPSVSNSGDFAITTEDGTFTQEGNIYTITSAGSYNLTGVLDDGQILVNAGKDDEVEINLNGVSITCNSDSPIKVLKADKVEISAKKKTSNLIKDNRSVKTLDNEELGEGAINAKCDLKLKGTGILVIEGNYSNGVHTTKDLTIQKEELYVLATNNALKGKDSITMVSGNVTAISKKGNGLKTDNSDISSKGNQRGSITISGGTLIVDAPNDALDASYNVIINEDNEDSLSTNITAKTGLNATYSANYSSSDSAKGLKADNIVDISKGNVAIKASDDAIHANYGEQLENEEIGLGNINISGGLVGLTSGDDAIHADNTLNISGGDIVVLNSKEGLEANHIEISDGNTYVYASDDGVNASRKIDEEPTILISGGFLDVEVSNGDTDGIDSNGTYTQTGGLVISRGSPNNANNMSTGLDAEGYAAIFGGTFIAFNGVEKTPHQGDGVLYAYYGSAEGPHGPHGPHPMLDASNITFNPGTYTLTGGEMNKTYKNNYSYSTFLIYSNEMSLNTAYTLNNGSSSVLSWTQNSNSQALQ